MSSLAGSITAPKATRSFRRAVRGFRDDRSVYRLIGINQQPSPEVQSASRGRGRGPSFVRRSFASVGVFLQVSVTMRTRVGKKRRIRKTSHSDVFADDETGEKRIRKGGRQH